MAEPAKKVRIRVAEAVESGVEGILLFVVRYFRTGASLLFSPRRMARRLLADRHAPKPTYVLPLTYLSIGLFLLSLLSQVAGLSILDWIWFIDELATKVTDALGKEISLVKVAVQALPGVVVVALFGLALRTALRRAPISSRMVPFVLSYAFGVQTWALFIAAFGFVVLGTLVGKSQLPGGKVGETVLAWVVYGSLLGALVSAFVAPLVFAISALRLRRVFRRARWRFGGIVLFLAFEFFFGHIALLYAMGLPAKVIALGTGPTTPDLTIRRQSYAVTGSKLQTRVSLTVRNRDSKPWAWETAKSDVVLFERKLSQQGNECSRAGMAEALHIESVVDGAGKPISFVAIEPGQTQWFEIITTQQESAWMNSNLKAKKTWDVKVSIEAVAGGKVEQCVEGSSN